LKKSKKGSGLSKSEIILLIGTLVISGFLAYYYDGYIIRFLGFVVLILSAIFAYERMELFFIDRKEKKEKEKALKNNSWTPLPDPPQVPDK
jgi:amino acid permease